VLRRSTTRRRAGWLSAVNCAARAWERARTWKTGFGVGARMSPVQFVQRVGIVQVVVEAVAQRPLLQQTLQ